ncbi:hypothetical protein TNCV_4982791 [Trichonephila clavipes]|uniref:Uncharacterized protein n=1 Tax=Trichonephila clavipes TaxID=2585209 RepID=A0A8X6WHL5_TRICX|nr:hypothetical protein TNCV_4982791 [Trichonephila clavipes]
MARRGECAKLFSDNGKNFVGASNEIKKLLEIVRNPDEKLFFLSGLLLVQQKTTTPLPVSLSCLTVGRRPSRSYAYEGELQMGTCLVVGKNVKETICWTILLSSTYQTIKFCGLTQLQTTFGINVCDKWLRNCYSAADVLFVKVLSNCVIICAEYPDAD